MNVPLFRLHNTMIDRLRAEQDLRTIRLLIAPTSSELYETISKSLTAELGKVSEIDKESEFEVQLDPNTGQDLSFDREGLAALKQDLM